MMRNFELETFFSKWEFKAKYNMTASYLECLSLSELLEMADPEDRASWDQLWLGYTETWGHPELRRQIACTYETMEAEDILCFAGAEEGIYIAMHTLLSAKDHVIVFVPNYQAAETIPLDRCDVTGIAMSPENQWSIDMDQVRDSIRPNTKLISINFPHNPTGKILEQDKYSELVKLCRERDIYLFNDEVYRLIEREPGLRLSQTADVWEKGLSLNVMSKSYGLPGLRIGWIACKDRQLLQRMERMKHYLSICNSGPSEQLAIIALKARDAILDRNRKLTRQGAKLVGDFFNDHDDLFEWVEPDGGCVGYPRYLGNDGVESFTSRLVEEAGILLLPSSLYRSELCETPKDHFRVGYCRNEMEEILDHFRVYLQKNYYS